jgi:hypothetical protein
MVGLREVIACLRALLRGDVGATRRNAVVGW